MIPAITEAILIILRDQVKTVPKTSIIARDGVAAKPKGLPAVYLSSPEFIVEEAGIAGAEPELKTTVEDKFNGDGKITEFELSEKPLRPLIAVQHPLGAQRKETEDYSVDYTAGRIRFREAPDKGKGNVYVRYNGAKSAAEQRSMELNLKYLLGISAKDQTECSEVAIDVLKALLIAKDTLEKQSIIFKIIGGRDLNEQNGTSKDGSVEKQIECTARTKLMVQIPSGAMEKILIREVE